MNRSRAAITSLRFTAPTVLELVLEKANSGFFPNFQPGQYATLSFPSSSRLRGERSFSIASSPTDRRTLRFGIRTIGRYTNAIRGLKPGDAATVGGPYGTFTYDAVRDRSAVLIAGGIGITPFMSMVRAALDRKLDNEITLIYCVRSLADAPFFDEIQRLARSTRNLRIVSVVSDGRIPAGAKGVFSGRITRELIDRILGNNLWGRSYFLCGPPPFMSSVTRMLASLGLPVSTVRTERFGVGSSAIIERGSPMPKIIFVAWGTAAVVLFGYIVRTEQNKRAAVLSLKPPSQALTQPMLPRSDAGTNASSVPVNAAPIVTPKNDNTTSAPIVPPAPTYTPPPQQVPLYRVVPRTAVS